MDKASHPLDRWRTANAAEAEAVLAAAGGDKTGSIVAQPVGSGSDELLLADIAPGDPERTFHAGQRIGNNFNYIRFPFALNGRGVNLAVFDEYDAVRDRCSVHRPDRFTFYRDLGFDAACEKQ